MNTPRWFKDGIKEHEHLSKDEAIELQKLMKKHNEWMRHVAPAGSSILFSQAVRIIEEYNKHLPEAES